MARIETDRLISDLVASELKARAARGGYKGKFAAQCHYLGYEGRCPPPTNFDSNYCYTLGLTAAALVGCGCTGMMAAVRGLAAPPEEWTLRGVPLTAMMNIERRKGKDKPVIRKALVELGGAPFRALRARRGAWELSSAYGSPGPVQFAGSTADEITLSLAHEQAAAAAAAAASAATASASAAAAAAAASAASLCFRFCFLLASAWSGLGLGLGLVLGVRARG